MSDILIRNMEMPKNCKICPCFQYDMFDDDIDGYCKALKTKIMNRSKHHPDCPLVEIPTPHGRLIDIKSVKNRKFTIVEDAYQAWWNGVLEAVIENAPTVIESEGEKDGK